MCLRRTVSGQHGSAPLTCDNTVPQGPNTIYEDVDHPFREDIWFSDRSNLPKPTWVECDDVRHRASLKPPAAHKPERLRG